MNAGNHWSASKQQHVSCAAGVAWGCVKRMAVASESQDKGTRSQESQGQGTPARQPKWGRWLYCGLARLPAQQAYGLGGSPPPPRGAATPDPICHRDRGLGHVALGPELRWKVRPLPHRPWPRRPCHDRHHRHRLCHDPAPAESFRTPSSSASMTPQPSRWGHRAGPGQCISMDLDGFGWVWMDLD